MADAKPNTDPAPADTAPAPVPTPAPAAEVRTARVKVGPVADRQDPYRPPLTLVKGDHWIETTHPGEIASLKAQGYSIKE